MGVGLERIVECLADCAKAVALGAKAGFELCAVGCAGGDRLGCVLNRLVDCERVSTLFASSRVIVSGTGLELRTTSG